ncbi:MAG: ferrous iron transport protein B [Clostridia bacterium]|nr:ferrous iron transport protein B [Clostridia bacterium]
MVIALVGNQNCGKTTLFNQLTGSNQHVGNFPGVTVEHKSGEAKGRKDCTIVDLPGIYSIRPYSGEEVVTRNFIIDNSPDAILNIADATNIERNLYLTLQLAEMGKPMVLALNMMDELLGNHGSVNIEELSSRLGIPVLPISAAKNDGVEELLELTMETARKKQKPKKVDFCGAGPVHRCIHTVSHVVEDHADAIGVPSRFAATRVIEQDEEIIKRLGLSENELELVEHAALEMERESGLDRNAALADMRYRFIESVCADTVVKAQESKEQQRSVKIDKVLTNKYLAIPTFLAIMAFIFWMTFDVIGQRLSDLLAVGIAMFTDWVDALLTAYGLNPVVQSLIIDGVFAGVGSMLSFLPLIVVLFFFLSILEDTGYMSRVAFVMDKLLRKIGLSGRSFVPMLIGFGCSVPAVMATRTLSSERDRKMTMLLVPFMSCSAKIPIYALFTAAFFPGDKLLVMTLLYIGGMLTGIVAAKILSLTSFTGKPVPFVMELPNYRMPSLKSVLLLMWEKASDFIRRAFTVIFLATIVIWFLQHFDAKLNIVEAGDGSSLLSLIGMSVAPIFAPLGFADWRIATSLITGLMAKEAVVSTMGVLMNASGSALAAALTGVFTTQSAIAFLAFALLYTPCVAAISAMRKELGSGLKTVGVVIGQCCVAWIVAFAVYCVAGLVL